MTHIMVDLETLGTKPGCVILNIRAIPFDPVAGTVDLKNHFYVNIDRASAEAHGLTVDPETEAWWLARSEETKQALTHDPRPLSEALDSFATWMEQHTEPRLWANDPDLDGTILGAAFDVIQVKRPWDRIDHLTVDLNVCVTEAICDAYKALNLTGAQA